MARSVIFDLGGVLIDWDPRHLYRKLFGDEAAMETFLAEICSPEWNQRQDEGRSFAAGVAELTARHPEHREMIEAYHARWPEMLAGALDDTVAILAELNARGQPLYALSNWSAETFPHARARFDFLGWFRGLVISGEEGIKKPSPAIFHLLFQRYSIDPAEAVFIDDSQANVTAARSIGLEALRFTSATTLREDLGRLEIL
ncbi:MAG: HAD family phosphatase [Rhodospirillales bacterium]|nr:HAD family phosphatase [Rhodospirillales bacterium]